MTDITRQAVLRGATAGPGSHTEHEGKTMSGAQAVVASLEAEGVDLVFGYPGGQAIKIYDALYDSTRIKHVLARHEQGAVHEADGYARATGRVGVAIVTSGPGATNTVTGIATAYMDSVPLVVITGQVPRGVIGTDSFQESDIVGITMPVVKHSYLLQSTDELTQTFREAFHIASTGRPGPVLIDVPSDLASEEMVFHYPDSVSLQSYKPTYKGNAKQVKQAVNYLKRAKRPVLYVGGGVISSGASEELVELADLMQIPVVTTLMAKGGFPASHPLNYGPIGMHGSKYANQMLTESDLLIACGARFSDRVTGRVDQFAPHADVIHIDIDPAEIGKVRPVQVPIVGDLKNVLAAITAELRKQNAKPAPATWLAQCESWRERWPFYHRSVGDNPTEIVPELAMELLSQKLDPHASVVVTEVGQHQMWAAQFIDREEPRSWESSGGLGTMGFGFPASIGAKLGCPDKQVVCVAGDGSFQMNSQEMATAAVHGLAGEGGDHGQPLPGYGAPVAEALLPRALFLHAARRGARLREAGRGVLLGGRARDGARRSSPQPTTACSPPTSPTCSTWPSRASRTSIPWSRRARASRRDRCHRHRGGRRAHGRRGRARGHALAHRLRRAGRGRRGRGRAMKHVLSVLVENKPGVLSRVTGLISRRGFNIESLSVGPTEDPTMSRVTAIVRADDVAYEQITKQLHKLISVHKINDLTDEGAIERELALFKVNATPERRNEIIEIANIFRAKIVDVGRSSLTIEATGDENKLRGIEDLLRAYGIKEIIRTGKVAMSRNSKEA